MIEYRDVQTLREQVRHVKTPRFNLKFRRSVTADLERLHRLDELRPAPADGQDGRPATNRPHTCLRCGQHLGSLKEQILHLHTVHKGKSWCRRCRTEFPSKQANQEHRAECRRVNCEGERGRTVRVRGSTVRVSEGQLCG